MPEITAKVGVPRALSLPYSLGYPLGAPNEPSLQRLILTELLHLCTDGALPILADFGLPGERSSAADHPSASLSAIPGR